MEARIVGGRFTVIEPPAYPLGPISPNREAIVLIGFVLAVLMGLATVVGFEAFDKTIHGGDAVAAITGARPLAVVPYLNNKEEMKASRIRNTVLAGSAAGALVVIAYLLMALSG
jgi:hypothetical protein